MNPYQPPIEKQERGTDAPAPSVFSRLGLFWLAVMFAISVGVSALMVATSLFMTSLFLR